MVGSGLRLNQNLKCIKKNKFFENNKYKKSTSAERFKKPSRQKGGGMATRGMGAALRGGGMALRGMGAAYKKK
jgi:hypothetical protein